MNNFVVSDLQLQNYLSSVDWDKVEYYGKRLSPKRELILKLIVSNFRMMSAKNSETSEEVFDILNQLDDLRRSQPAIFFNFPQLYVILEIFLTNLCKTLTEKFLIKIDAALTNYLTSFIQKEVNIEMLKINLKFVLGLTNNVYFMNWLKTKQIDLFKVMKYNIDLPYMTMEAINLTAKIHYNLLVNYYYSSKFLYNTAKIDQTIDLIMAMENAGITWLKNVVLLSYIKPRGLRHNISSFFIKINGLLYKELRQERLNWKVLQETIGFLRRFCSNVFKAQNELLIRQILDENLARSVISLMKKCEGHGDIMPELLNMITLFMVDDVMIDLFVSSDIVSILEGMMETKTSKLLTSKGTVMNILVILKAMFDHKPYAFSKRLKVNFLVFLLKNYAHQNESVFKNDLIGLLITVYESKDFRELLVDPDVLKELKYRTDITQLEDLIHRELENNHQSEVLITPTAVKDWQADFPLFKAGHKDYVGIVDKASTKQSEALIKVGGGDFEPTVPSETSLVEKKFLTLEAFFDQIKKSFGNQSQILGLIESSHDELLSLKKLIDMEFNTLNVKWKEKFDQLNKTNSELKEMVINLDDLVNELGKSNELLKTEAKKANQAAKEASEKLSEMQSQMRNTTFTVPATNPVSVVPTPGKKFYFFDIF